MDNVFMIIGIFAIPLAIGILLGFWPSPRKRRHRALNRLADRALNQADRAS